METLTLQREALTETYNDTENLINKTVYQFYKRYGGDFEELQAEANLIFIQIYNSYKKHRSRFSTWLCFCIWKGLLDCKNKLYRQTPKPIIDGNEEDIQIIEMLEDRKKHTFSSLELFDGIGDDAETVIRLIWNMPHDLPIKNGNHPCHIRASLRKYLRDAGWTWRRIKESFDEITELIND